MDKKVVIVTGGSKGIGSEICKKFAKEGYNVVLNYLHSENEAFKLKYDIENLYKINVLPIKADMSKEEDIKFLITETIKNFNRIDSLVNNAAIAIDKPFLDKTKEDFNKVLNTNLVGPFLICKYAYNYLINCENSTIVNVSSTNAINSYYPESADYDASKAALISLTKNLSIVFSPNVRVNAVAPGWVNTDMNKDLNKKFIKDEEKKILLNRFANPSEIANVVYFLASNDSSYINGEVIVVDGGYNGY